MGKKHRKKVACGVCKRSFGTENAVWTHIAFQHSAAGQRAAKPVFSCTGCNGRFTSAAEISEHLESIKNASVSDQSKSTGDVDGSESMEVSQPAEKSTSNETEEASSQRLVHNSPVETQEPDEQEEESEVKCTSFKIHCALCRKRFSTDNALWTHIAFKHARYRDTNTVLVKYICDNCKQVFESIDLINQHCHIDKEITSSENANFTSVIHADIRSSKCVREIEKIANNNPDKDIEIIAKKKSNRVSEKKANINHKKIANSKPDKEILQEKTGSVDEKLARDQPEYENKVITRLGRKSLDDSFEGQEGIQVVYDEDNENDDFEDEEYSKIDDILHSQDSIGPSVQPSVNHNATRERNLAIVTDIEDSLDDFSQAQKDETDGPVLHSSPKRTKEPSKTSESTPHSQLPSEELSQDDDDAMEDSSGELDASNSSKEVSLSDLLEDETEFHNKITLLSSMFTNELLTSRVRYLESKVEELQEYMSKLLEEEENKTDDCTQCSSMLEATNLPEQAPVYNKHNQGPDSDRDRDVDREGPDSDVSSHSSSCKETSTRILSPPQKTYMMALDSDSVETVPLQCDKIESTTSTYDLSGELITFTEDSVCEEVEVNTSNSEEDSRDSEVRQEDSGQQAGAGQRLVNGDYCEMAVNIEQTYQCSNDIEEGEKGGNENVDSSHILNVEGLDSSTTLIVSDDSTELGIVLNGDALTNVVTFLDSADGMEDDTALDSVVFEQIRNGHISSHELDSLFTSAFSESPSAKVNGEEKDGPTLVSASGHSDNWTSGHKDNLAADAVVPGKFLETGKLLEPEIATKKCLDTDTCDESFTILDSKQDPLKERSKGGGKESEVAA